MATRAPFHLDDTGMAVAGYLAGLLACIAIALVPTRCGSSSRSAPGFGTMLCGTNPEASLESLSLATLAVAVSVLVAIVVPKSDLVVRQRPRSAPFASLMRRSRLSPVWIVASACIALGAFGLVQGDLDGKRIAGPVRISRSPAATESGAMESVDVSLIVCGGGPSLPVPGSVGACVGLFVAGTILGAGTLIVRIHREA